MTDADVMKTGPVAQGDLAVLVDLNRAGNLRGSDEPGAVQSAGLQGTTQRAIVSRKAGSASVGSSGVIGVTIGIGLTGSLLGAGAVSAWVVPAIIFVLLIVASWLGLRWIRSEHLEALRAVPLFSLLSERELMAVLRSAHAVAFQPGARVIELGERGRGFFDLDVKVLTHVQRSTHVLVSIHQQCGHFDAREYVAKIGFGE
jgi:hypothetical protein